MMLKNKKYTVIGGGTGTFSVLRGLKKYTDNITAIVTMADSGGSAKKERDEWGLLPSSDIRKSLIALADISSEDSLLLRKLFQYRYSQGKGVKGMTFGNLFLVALTKLLDSQSEAIKSAGKLLGIKGKVLPVSLDNVDLVAEYEDGSKVVGEHFIDQPKHNGKLKITKLYTYPQANISDEAKKEIQQSDVIILGPGGFYTTILANLVVKGVTEAIQKSKAKKIYILNLMSEYGQTFGFEASNFIDELYKYIPDIKLDLVVINNADIPSHILKRYNKYHAAPINNDINGKHPFKIYEADLLTKRMVKIENGDFLNRSFIRHNADKLIKACIKGLSLL